MFFKVKKSVLFCVLAAFLAVTVCTSGKCYYLAVEKMGYNDVSHKPCEVVLVNIPQTFDKVYARYNTLLKEGGWDLYKDRGKTVTRYTYYIPSVNSRANILVYNGKIIGGDICGITLDSIMVPIIRQNGVR